MTMIWAVVSFSTDLVNEYEVVALLRSLHNEDGGTCL